MRPINTRRWLINASGRRNAVGRPCQAPPRKPRRRRAPERTPRRSRQTRWRSADYVAKTLDRELPCRGSLRGPSCMCSTLSPPWCRARGSSPGELAARYVDSLGRQTPKATVIGSGIVTSAVNAALAKRHCRLTPTRPTTPIRSARFHPRPCSALIVGAGHGPRLAPDRNGP